MRNSGGAVNGGWTTNLLGNQGGGWCSHLSIANDGWKVLGTDTGQAYVRGPAATSWTPLINPPTTVTATELDTIASANQWGDEAIYDIDIAKTNSQVLYFATYGFVWKSTNRGGTITRTARAYDSNLTASGASNRMCGRRLAIDPAGTAVVALGHQTSGLYYTTDSGATWTQNASIPAPTATGGDKNVLIAYDVTSATSGTPLQTQTVYVYVGGKGVYKSTTGISGTFSLMTSSPIAASTIICCAGKPFVAGGGGNSDATIQFYNGTAWTSSGSSAQTLCYNPSVTTNMWALTSSGDVLYSSNTGTSFTNVTSSKARSATDVPWLAYANESYMSNGDVVYDATNTLLTFAEGIGVWTMTPPTAAAALTWTSISSGVANLVAVHATITPAGKIITSSHDRAFHGLTRTGAGTAATAHGVNNSTSIRHGQMTDYAIDNNNFIVGVDWGGGTIASPLGGVSYSTNGGAPNTYFATQPTPPNDGTYVAYGGNIACGNASNFVFIPTNDGGVNNARPQYTTDGGTTWANCVFNATYDGQMTQYHHAYYLTRQMIVADKANPGTFYLYCVGDGSASAANTALLGVWKSTNGGATWSRVYASNINTQSKDYFNGKLKMSSAGHLTWCAGGISGYYDTPDSVTLMFSNTGGASWASISGLSEPVDFAWGVAKPGASYQTLYAYGWVGGVRGLYRMDDFNPATPGGTWTLLDRWPGGLTGGNLCISADPNSYGRLVIGSSIVGFRYLDYTDTAHGT